MVSLEAERPGGLIQRCREALQLRHYACLTMSFYGLWLGRFLGFHPDEPSGDRGRRRALSQMDKIQFPKRQVKAHQQPLSVEKWSRVNLWSGFDW